MAIEHRLSCGRLHRVKLGPRPLLAVYAVGSPELTQRGRFMAAVLRCGGSAYLSHRSAAVLLGLRSVEPPLVELTVARAVDLRSSGVKAYRRPALPAEDRRERDSIPVTSAARTLIDLATCLEPTPLEAAVNAADRLDLVDPEALREAVEQRRGQPGVPALRRLLDRDTFRLTDSELERLFLRIVRRTALPMPETGVRLNGFKVDFYWPELNLVVETDGLRYHRTPSRQRRDNERDQAHAVAGVERLRFSHYEVRHAPGRVAAKLWAVASRREGQRPPYHGSRSRYGPQQ